MVQVVLYMLLNLSYSCSVVRLDEPLGALQVTLVQHALQFHVRIRLHACHSLFLHSMFCSRSCAGPYLEVPTLRSAQHDALNKDAVLP